MHSEREQRQVTDRAQARSRFREAAESAGYFRKEGSARISQDQLFVQTFEKLHTQAAFQRLDLLADRARGDMQFLRGEFEAEMARGGLKSPKRVEWRQNVGHSRQYRIEPRDTCNRFSAPDMQERAVAGSPRPRHRVAL